MDLKKLHKLKAALDDFMENLDIDGVCGFWSHVIDDDEPHPDEEFTGQELAVYLILDRKKNNFSARGNVRQNVRKMIKDYLNIDIYVGSVAKDCD